MKTTLKLTLLFATGAALAACGGSSKKGSGGIDAPPKVDGPNPIDRKLTSEAKAEFTEALAYYQEQGKGGWNKGNCNSAAEKFKDVANSYPKLVEARFNAGVSYHNCGMTGEAEEQYKAALKIHPHGASMANLGKIYWDQGNESAAKQYWEQAINANKKLAAPRNNLAWLMIRQIRTMPKGSNFEEIEKQAKLHLQSALAVENDNVEAYVLLALLYMEGSEKNKSRLDLARLLLEKAEEANKSFAPLWNARGLLLMRRQNPAEALKHFASAIALDANFSEAHLNAGNVVLDFRKYDEAASHFESVLKRQSKNFEAAIGLGMAKRGLRDYAAAEKSYEDANGMDPKRGEAEFNLGILYMNFKASENADEASTEALKKPYREAIGHFRKAVNKPLAAQDMKTTANANIELCEKQIKQIDEFAAQEAKFKVEEAQREREEAAAKAAEEKANPGGGGGQ